MGWKQALMVGFAATGFFAAGGIKGWAMGGLEQVMLACATVDRLFKELTVMIVVAVWCVEGGWIWVGS